MVMSVLGWPFAGLVSVPMLLDSLRAAGVRRTLVTGVVASAVVMVRL